MGKGGGGGWPITWSTSTIQFAPYIEAAHSQMINTGGLVPLTISVFAAMNSAFGQSPYGTKPTVVAADGFISGGVITAFPSLFDTFTTYLSDIDLMSRWTAFYNEGVQGSEISDAAAATSAMLQDEIDSKAMPRFLGGFRDINAVQSSAFIIGKALIEDSKIKTLNEYISKLKLQEVSLAQDRWAKSLDWNKSVVGVYAEIMKMFYAASFDEQSRAMEYAVKDKLWNLSLFEYGRSVVAALNGSAAARPENQPSQASKSIAGVMAGSAAGAEIGQMVSPGGTGAAIGAGIGGVLGLAGSFM